MSVVLSDRLMWAVALPARLPYNIGEGRFHMSDSLKVAAEEVRKRALDLVQSIVQDEKMTELKKLVAGLNTLEDLSGQPKTGLAALFNLTPEVAALTIAPDEFYGLEPLIAAKEYLKKIGKTGTKSAQFGDIVTAIKAGGGDPGNEDKLRVSLARSTYEVVKIGEDRYGLVEFFEHVERKRGAKKKRGDNSSDSDSPETESSQDTEVENGTTTAGEV